MASCKIQDQKGDRLRLESTPPVSFSSEAPKEPSSTVQRGLVYIRENALSILWQILWMTANTTIFSLIFQRYRSSEFFPLLGYGICFARATGYLLMFNVPLCVLMMCRWLFTVGEKWGFGHLFPFSRHVVAHKILGWTTLPLSVVHVSAHYYNAYRVSTAEPELFSRVLGNKFDEQPTFVGYLYMTLPGITGHVAFVFLICMYIFAHESLRVKHFEKFSIIHRSYMIVNFALMLHGRLEIFESSKFIIFFSIPGTIYSIERFLRMLRGTKRRKVLEGTLTKKNTIHLQVERQNLTYYPGQWGYVNFPGVSALQWHPFSIVSHPEDPYLAFDIRPIGDWTHCLRNLLVTGPGQKAKAKKIWMKFDGPFGASTLKALEKDVTVLVVSGIGVTRFISLVRQLKIIMLSAAVDGPYRRFSSSDSPTSCASGCQNMDFVPMDVISASLTRRRQGSLHVPRKLYLFWVYREKSFLEDFSWFVRDLQHEAIKDVLEVHTFWAGAPANQRDAHNFEIFPVPRSPGASGVTPSSLRSPPSPQLCTAGHVAMTSHSFETVVGTRDSLDGVAYLAPGHETVQSEGGLVVSEGHVTKDGIPSDTGVANGHATSQRHVADTSSLHRRSVSRVGHVTDDHDGRRKMPKEHEARSDQLDALLECAGDRDVTMPRDQSRDVDKRSEEDAGQSDTRFRFGAETLRRSFGRVMQLVALASSSRRNMSTSHILDFRDLVADHDVGVTTGAATEQAPDDVTRPAWLTKSSRCAHVPFRQRPSDPAKILDGDDVTLIAPADWEGHDVTNEEENRPDPLDLTARASAYLVTSRAPVAPRSEPEARQRRRKSWVGPVENAQDVTCSSRGSDSDSNSTSPLELYEEGQRVTSLHTSALGAKPLELTCEDTASHVTPTPRPYELSCDVTWSDSHPVLVGHGFTTAIQSVICNGHVGDGHVGSGHMGDGHVGSGHVGDGHMNSGHVGNGHVSSGHVGDGHVGRGHEGNGHVSSGGHVGDGHVCSGHVGNGHVSGGHVGDGHVGDTWGDDVARIKVPVTNIRHWAGKPDWATLFAQIQSAHVTPVETTTSRSRSRAGSLVTALQRRRSSTPFPVSIRRRSSSVAPTPTLAHPQPCPAPTPTPAHPQPCPASTPTPALDRPTGLGDVAVGLPNPDRIPACASVPLEPCSKNSAAADGWAWPVHDALVSKNSHGRMILNQQQPPANQSFRHVGVYCSGTLWLHRDVTQVCHELNAKRQAGWPEFVLEKSD